MLGNKFDLHIVLVHLRCACDFESKNAYLKRQKINRQRTYDLQHMLFFADSESRYQALLVRNPQAEGHFVYAVTTTRIVCRPTCSSRLALRKNIVFFDSVAQAMELGYRPCKRCLPEVVSGWNRTRNCVLGACAILGQWAKTNHKLNLDLLALTVGLSKWHFCRVFKMYTGHTPRRYFVLCGKGHYLGGHIPLVQTKKYLQAVKGGQGVDDVTMLLLLWEESP